MAKHYRSLQQLFKFLIDDGEITSNPMERMSPPSVPEQPVPILTDDELIAADRRLQGHKPGEPTRRGDHPHVHRHRHQGIGAGRARPSRMSTWASRSRCVMGKGGRGRAVPFGIRTTDALRRYLKARRQHPLAASTQALWLGRKGPLTVSGVAQLLERRGADAGVDRSAPAPVPAHDGAPLALRWRAGAGPDEARRLAYPGDGRQVRSERC